MPEARRTGDCLPSTMSRIGVVARGNQAKPVFNAEQPFLTAHDSGDSSDDLADRGASLKCKTSACRRVDFVAFTARMNACPDTNCTCTTGC